MTGRPLLPIIFALFCYVSPLSAGDAQPSPHVQSAKLNVDDKPRPHRKQEVSRRLIINERYEYYDIQGANIAELERQMRQRGTRLNNGKVYAALTTWDIRYTYEISEHADNYSIDSVITDISVVYRLPNRLPVATVNSALLSEQWERYLLHLKEHEYGHKQISVKAAAEINQTLAGLGSFNSREQLQREAKRQVAALFKRLKELQITYDDETNHGIKQGAVLAASEQAQASLSPGQAEPEI